MVSDETSVKDRKSPQLTEEYQKLHVKPWDRFFARNIDLGVLAIVYGSFGIFYPDFISENNVINSFIILFCWFLIEPIFLSIFGATLGKFLFNIKIRDVNDKKPKFYNSFVRSFRVWCQGYGFGIPIVFLFTLISSYSKLKKTGTTAWDKDKFVVTHGKYGFIKSIISFLIIATIIGLTVLGFVSEKYQLPNQQISVEDYAKEIEKENKALPQMIDSETEFFKMKFSNYTLSYQYRLVNKRAFKIDESMQTYLKNQLLSKVCKTKELEPTLARGFNLSFEYFDKNMKHITTILVKPSDCKLTE